MLLSWNPLRNKLYNYIMKLLSLIFLLFTYIFSLNLNAAELKIEPVYGVERTQREFPAPARYRTSTFLGARALYGISAFSFEFELNQSTSKEDFPEDNLSVTYIDQKALLGFRSYPVHSKYVGLFFRFGARAQKNKREIVENDVQRNEEDPLRFDPYAGTGLTLAAGKAFALNAGATLVYNRNATDEAEKYDTRYSFSFTIRAGNK